nr:hypothetical protein Iba_chr04dCG8230 [Ipomoea batatas]
MEDGGFRSAASFARYGCIERSRLKLGVRVGADVGAVNPSAAAPRLGVVVMAVELRVGGGEAAVDHGGLEIRPFGVLPFPLVRVLVAAEGLRSGEIPAAVVALEFPAAFAAVAVIVFAGGRRRVDMENLEGAEGGKRMKKLS